MMTKSSKSKSRYDVTSDIIPVGYKAHGWELIEKYEHFNLWQRKGIRECFFEGEIPNENSTVVIFG